MNEPLNILAANIAKGDERSYDALFKRYYIPLVLFSVRFVDSKEVAEDIVQDFFCKIWEEREKLNKVKALKTYLYISVKNRSLNYERDKRIDMPLDILIKDDDNTTLEQIMEEEIYRELANTIDLLPPKCKEIFLLNVEGIKTPQIAEDLGISVETVRVQVKKARRIIKENLSNLMSLFLV